MARSAILFPPASTRNREAHCYWSALHGEFPWCLDESEQTDASSELIGTFDLVLADPPRITRTHSARMRTPLDRARPDTSWVAYAELFLAERGSLLVIAPLEAIGAYTQAFASAGLIYQAAYVWQHNNENEGQPLEAVLWATKGAPRVAATEAGEFIQKRYVAAPANLKSIEEERQWLIERLIETFTIAEMRVLEPFMNNCQLLLACQKLQRYALGIARRRSHIKQAEQLLADNLKRTA